MYQLWSVLTDFRFTVRQYTAYIIARHLVSLPITEGIKHKIIRLLDQMVFFTVTAILIPDFPGQRCYPVFVALAIKMDICLAIGRWFYIQKLQRQDFIYPCTTLL